MLDSLRRELLDIYRGEDPRHLPLYSFAELAHYLTIPKATLRAWFLGQKLGGNRRFRSVLSPADPGKTLLSFVNVIEAHVLDALRREHRISLQKVRLAIRFLQERFPSPHPLVDNAFATDGLDLFVEKYSALVNVSREGQFGMRQVLEAYLQRIEWDTQGLPRRLFPYTRLKGAEAPRFVVIDPRVAFGRPVLAASGIPTSVIAQRYKAGESIGELIDDYQRPQEEIEEAIRLEVAA